MTAKNPSRGINPKEIMLSYELDDRQFASDVYEQLKSEGIPVSWNKPIKDFNPSGKRSSEITQSLAICVFMTPKYQASKLAEKELGFAQRENIPLIPCLVTPEWKPTAWLSFSTADLDCIDFRDRDPIALIESMNELVNYIRLNILKVAPVQFPELRIRQNEPCFAGRLILNGYDPIPYEAMQGLRVEETSFDDNDHNSEQYEPDDEPKNSSARQNDVLIRAAIIYPRSNRHPEKTRQRKE